MTTNSDDGAASSAVAHSSRTIGLPSSSPEAVGLSSLRLAKLSQILKRTIDKGDIPGAVVVVGRHGQVAHCEALGLQDPLTNDRMRLDSVFRIWSMTKPIVSVACLQLVEDGELLLTDPVAKYLPAFATVEVSEERDGKLHLSPLQRPITVQDLLRHTSGIISPGVEPGALADLYVKAEISSRSLTNKENAARLANLPLSCQPGSAWKYSRSSDLLGSVIEEVSGRTLGEFLAERIFQPLAMTDTGFFIDEHRSAGRLAQPFSHDPWTGESVAAWTFDMTERPRLEAGGLGLVSTAIDYARFVQMLANGGTLDREHILGRKTIELMTADHLGPGVKVDSDLLPPGHGFGLGFAVRREPGMAPYPGSVGQYYWFGAAGTQFWHDPGEDLWAVLMVQAPGQRDYLRNLIRNLVYAALEK